MIMAEAIAINARQLPLVGQVFAGADVAITPAQEAYRCNLRCGSSTIPALSKALGLDLPRHPKSSVTSGTRTVLWLGPDEWLIIDTNSSPDKELEGVKVPFSAVDVSHRNTAILVSGSAAADVINGGCPQDLSMDAFPVGAASRTVLGKCEIVLFRVKPTVFRVEVWRSFSQYAFAFLTDAAKDAA